MEFESYQDALLYLKDHYGGLHEVAKACGLDVGGRWLHQTLKDQHRKASDGVRNAVIEHAEGLREKELKGRGDVDGDMIRKIKALHEEYGSWQRAGRRIGAPPSALRLAVKEGVGLPEETRQKIIDASRRSDLEELIGFLCVGIGLQMVDALRDTSLSADQKKILDKAEGQLQDYNRLLQTGNMQELRDKIRDGIDTLNEPIQNGHEASKS